MVSLSGALERTETIMSEITNERTEGEVECPSELVFRWDSKGGWLVVPIALFKRVNSAVTSVNSHVDEAKENVYLDEKQDANEFARGLQCLFNLESTVPVIMMNFRTLKGVAIMDICDGAVSSIRRYKIFRHRVNR